MSAPGGVVVDDEVAEPEQRLLVDCAEQLEHGLDGDLAAGRRRELVERRHRVAEASLRRPRDERQRRVRHVEALAVRHPAEEDDELREARPLKEERLAARANRRAAPCRARWCRRRRRDAAEAPRRSSAARSRRRPSAGAPRRGCRPCSGPAGWSIAPSRIARTSSIPRWEAASISTTSNERAVGDRDARLARAVRLRRRPLRAVERLGEDACERRLARAARAGEEIRLAHAVRLDRVPQRPRHRLLPDHLVEVLRPVLAVERGHSAIVWSACSSI